MKEIDIVRNYQEVAEEFNKIHDDCIIKIFLDLRLLRIFFYNLNDKTQTESDIHRKNLKDISDLDIMYLYERLYTFWG